MRKSQLIQWCTDQQEGLHPLAWKYLELECIKQQMIEKSVPYAVREIDGRRYWDKRSILPNAEHRLQVKEEVRIAFLRLAHA